MRKYIIIKTGEGRTRKIPAICYNIRHMKTNRKDNLNERYYAFATEQFARGGVKPRRKLSWPPLAACGLSRTRFRR